MKTLEEKKKKRRYKNLVYLLLLKKKNIYNIKNFVWPLLYDKFTSYLS